jgi:surface antigen
VNNDPVNWVDLWGLKASDVRQKMADLAKSKKDSDEWKTEGARDVPGIGNFKEESYKCNLYVYEVAIEAGAEPGVLQKAGSWGNKDTDISGWRVLDKNETPQPGDVVAITYPPGSLSSGHIGIVVDKGKTSNTWDEGIIRINNFGFREEDKNAIFRRWEGNE